MHKIVIWIGAVTAGIGVAAFAIMLMAATPSRNIAGVLLAFTTGGSLVLAGAVLYCFGAIVEHLTAIRAALERRPI